MSVDKKLLEKLLLDIDVLNELDRWTNDINFFQISGMENQEIKHSKTLAWFFDPNENHGLKDQFIRRFIQKVVSTNIDVVNNVNIFDVALIDYSSFIVKRERSKIDILIYSNELKIVFVIENKVYANESNNQLTKYFKIVQDEFLDYKKVFVFLTREGDEPSDAANWCIANYRMIIDSLEESINSNVSTLNNKTKVIVEDYIKMIRRNFGMDNELKQTAQKIYLKHKRAFDLIFDVANTGYSDLSEYIKDWIKTNKDKYSINYDEKFSTNSIIRFTTPYIDEMFPFDENKSDGWGYGHSFMYEIGIDKYRIRLVGVLSNFETPNSNYFVNFVKGNNRAERWKRILKATRILSEEDIADGLTDDVKNKLDKALIKVVTKDIIKFENDIKEFISKQV